MHRALAWKRDTLIRWLDESVPPEKLAAFLAVHSSEIAKLPEPVIPTEAEMEKTLRHVEVKRRQCFVSREAPRLTQTQLWVKRHKTAILFCRYARLHCDLRYLNAAFKLNDWAFRRYQHSHPSDAKSLYLAALQEQELTAQELLK